ncbi:winged helix-turn-helix transcriptional regulator [Alicyclobacillus curvatus]|nr:winged helix-turn-helix transcriptional regulator [Alicyclobacillus curvatus]
MQKSRQPSDSHTRQCEKLWTVGGRKLSRKNSLPLSSLKSNGSAPKHDVFQAIADPTRRGILTLLVNEEMPIASIVERFPMSRTAVNKHLHVLSDAGLVMSRRQGRETRFRADPAPLVEVKQWVSFFEQYWDEKLHSLIQYVESDEE